MEPINKRFIIGIDLGTTNSALSYVDLEAEAEDRKIRLFQVPQLSAPGEVARQKVLPSFLYLPGPYDVPPESIVLPWPAEKDRFVGVFAREQGSKVPGRLVSSAKSWLCHSKVDRTAAILPWTADKGVSRVSPVEATARYLAHLRDAWNHAQGGDEDLYLENQFVIVTVPASFDEVARDFTVEAAKKAGLPDVTLLEEPLAAFYSWLVFHEKDWQNFVKPGELICAVDVGGGTTDFTLIMLREVDGSPRFERIAVGDHLILGGDNMDLALARITEARMGKGRGLSLSANRWQSLCHQCREAKEAILSGSADERTITLMGEGSSLIGGTLSAKLDRAQIEETILEGFFPLVSPESPAPEKKKGGLTEFGLPYEQDPAIIRQLCRFLLNHSGDVKNYLDRDVPFPDLLLFNGGSLKPPILQERIRKGVAHWFGEDRLPGVLANPDLDLAVSRGAAYYGLVKAGEGVRVGSGSARGYYLAVSNGEADQEGQALCLIERGVEEGSVIELSDKDFLVRANQPVSFQVYSSSFRSGDRAGDLVTVDETLTKLPPIHTVIQFGKKAGQKEIPVHMEAHFTEMGTLALYCRSVHTDHRWRLQFQVRDAGEAGEVADAQVFEESEIQAVRDLVSGVFSRSADSLPPERLANAIADVLSLPRDKWPLSFIRRLADDLLENLAGRRITAEHEARWLNLLGFCLRPGFGDALDEHRLRKLWPEFKKGPAFANNPQARLEWWVLWRRVAGGLTAGQQRQIFQEISSLAKPKKGAKAKTPPQELNEIWMLLANLERLQVKDKAELGRHLAGVLHPKKTKAQELWSLSRFGARELLYGPLDRVVGPQEVSDWIAKLLAVEWKNPRPAAQALARLARKTGDRKRDIEPEIAGQVAGWLDARDEGAELARMVREALAVNRQEEASQFGESLPAGIILHSE